MMLNLISLMLVGDVWVMLNILNLRAVCEESAMLRIIIPIIVFDVVGDVKYC